MPSGEERRLKLVRGTAADESSTADVPRQADGRGRGATGAARRSGEAIRQPARGGRTTPRRTVTRRVPAAKDPVEEILERLDQEPVDRPESATADPDDATDPERATVRENATDSEDATDAEDPTGTDRDTASGTDPDSDSGRADPVSEAAGGRGGPGRRSPVTTVALVAALCAALALAGFFGNRWWQDHAVARAHTQALAAARQTTVNFVSVSASSVDSDLQRITAGATGEFREEFVRGQAKVRQAVLENKVESRGTVLRAGLLSGNRRHAVVLVAMDATVKNVNAPDGRPAHYRIQVDLTRDGDSDTWLVSRLQFVG
ncbi:hypothetical protein [Plantactinospora sp. WMMB782]|uniref:hypothetical protein n=1 Tax=Plantactinospora sp. WMMB782 TaxID=3404121 RepID=UPI003B947983